MSQNNYQKEYQSFVADLNSGVSVDPVKVGILISKLAQYYSDAVQSAVVTEMAYNKKLVEFEQTADDNGKPITSAKATNLSHSTKEYEMYQTAKGNISAIEQMINALKSLQKAVLNEYSHFTNS